MMLLYTHKKTAVLVKKSAGCGAGFCINYEDKANGAGEEIRTLDIDLGKVALYH